MHTGQIYIILLNVQNSNSLICFPLNKFYMLDHNEFEYLLISYTVEQSVFASYEYFSQMEGRLRCSYLRACGVRA